MNSGWARAAVAAATETAATARARRGGDGEGGDGLGERAAATRRRRRRGGGGGRLWQTVTVTVPVCCHFQFSHPACSATPATAIEYRIGTCNCPALLTRAHVEARLSLWRASRSQINVRWGGLGGGDGGDCGQAGDQPPTQQCVVCKTTEASAWSVEVRKARSGNTLRGSLGLKNLRGAAKLQKSGVPAPLRVYRGPRTYRVGARQGSRLFGGLERADIYSRHTVRSGSEPFYRTSSFTTHPSTSATFLLLPCSLEPEPCVASRIYPVPHCR